MSTSRRTPSTRSARSSSTSTNSTATVRQPRWRIASTSTSSAAASTSTSYVFAESKMKVDGEAREVLSSLDLGESNPKEEVVNVKEASDEGMLGMLKERLPVQEVNGGEPVRFGVDDSTPVGGGAADTVVLTDSPVSTTPSPTTPTPAPPASSLDSPPDQAQASSSTTATSLVTAAPFPSTTTSTSTPPLPSLSSSSPQRTEKKNTGWLGSFSKTQPTPEIQTPVVQVETIDLPFPSPKVTEGLPILHSQQEQLQSATAATSSSLSPPSDSTPTTTAQPVQVTSTSSSSLPLPSPSSTRTPTSSRPTSPTPTPKPKQTPTQARKQRSWFSSSPISSSPLATSSSSANTPPVSRRIAAAAKSVGVDMQQVVEVVEVVKGVVGLDGVVERAQEEREGGEKMNTAVDPATSTLTSNTAPASPPPTPAPPPEKVTEKERIVSPPPMVHTISIDDAVPKIQLRSKDTSSSESTSLAPSIGALSPPVVGAVPPTSGSRFVFGIPLLRGRAGTVGSSASRTGSWDSGRSKAGDKDRLNEGVEEGKKKEEIEAPVEVKPETEAKGNREDAGDVVAVANDAASIDDGGDRRAAVAVGSDAVKAFDEQCSTKNNIKLTAPSQLNVQEHNNEAITSQASNPAATSWWGLIGWSTTTTTGTSTLSMISNPSKNVAAIADERHSIDQSAGTGTGIRNDASTDSEHTSAKTEEISPEEDEAKSASVTQEDSSSAVKQDPSTTSAVDNNNQLEKLDTEGDNHVPNASSTWYSPWAWYSYTSSSSQVDASTASVSGMQHASVEQPRRPEDERNVDGSADDSATEAVPADSVMESREVVEREPLRSPQSSEVNPIASTIETNRSGWASFFTSKALVVKTLGYTSSDSSVKDVKRDDDGNEIMDLDESDDDEPVAARGRTRELTVTGPSSLAKGTKAIEAAPTTRTAEGTRAGLEAGDGNAPAMPDEKSARGKHPTAPPLTISEGIRRETVQSNPANKVSSTSKSSKPSSRSSTPVSAPKRTSSPTPSAKKAASPPPPNLVLPTWQDTFHTPPRNYVPPRSSPSERDSGVTGKLYGKTMKFVNGILFARDEGGGSRKGKEKEDASHQRDTLAEKFRNYGLELPRAWHVVEEAERAARVGRTESTKRTSGKGSIGEDAAEVEGMNDILKGCKRVVVIGVHGWFPGAVMRSVLGEPTGTSSKFVNMMVQAIDEFATAHGVQFEKITKIPLEGEGTIDHRVARLYTNLRGNDEWMDDLHAADAIFVATHSQGSVVSTHLLDCLIRDRHIRTAGNSTIVGGAESFPSAAGASILPFPKPQRVCCLAQCGIHLGPLRYLSSSSLLQPYIQYFESAAARELFEFQNTNSDVSKSYVKALENVLANGTKMVYVASLNDQVVPIYSGLFTAASHPLILRALYIDGDAYHSSDFLSNLLVLMLRILNTTISDSGLLAHLSEATAGSLNGVGHSTSYEELATYSLAVKYLFLTNDGLTDHPALHVEPFDAMVEQNDYEIPWSLRDIIADERVAHFFGREILELRDAFREWHPKTAILRDLKRKLQPIQRLPASFSIHASSSKL